VVYVQLNAYIVPVMYHFAFQGFVWMAWQWWTSVRRRGQWWLDLDVL